MPCYTIITNTVEFKIENIDLLKKALEKTTRILNITENTITVRDKFGNLHKSNLKEGKVISNNMLPGQQTDFLNSVKRAYSKEVVDVIAEKNKWIKRQINQTQYQLQRY